MIYELKITLSDVGVSVWRVVQIQKGSDFHDLHDLIQVAFEWENSHLYEYRVDVSNGKKIEHVEITDQEIDIDTTFMPVEIETHKLHETTLSHWFKKPKDKITYTYDFGDNWEHEIELIQEIEADKNVEYPRCIKAKNYAPPEDSRFEIIQGEIDLIAGTKVNKIIPDEVNDNIYFDIIMNDDDEELDEFIRDEFGDMRTFQPVSHNEEYSEVWESSFKKAKDFLQAKPWETLTEHDIFAIVDPSSGRYLFCRVVGHGEVQYGLEIYLDIDGFFGLLSLLAGEELTIDGLQKEHLLLLTFEDRDKLSKMDYNLIKAHSTTFRGKKSWPEFISFEPGYFPWTMKEEEALLTQFVMSEILTIQKEVENGLVIPSVLEEQMILIREMDEENTFENRFSDVEALLQEDVEEELVLSEIEVKRFTKLIKRSPVEIEFAITPIEIPIQTKDNERPFYATLTVAIDVEDGSVIYQDTSDQPQNLYIMQQSFLTAMVQVGGIPSVIYTDSNTARAILPFLDVKDFDIEIEEELEGVPMLVEGLTEYLKGELEE